MLSSPRTRLSLLVLMLIVSLFALQPIGAQEAPAGPIKLLSFSVNFSGKTYDSATNQSTFSYLVTSAEQQPDLSHFDLGLPSCTPPLLIASTSPAEAVSFGVDPITGVDGLKWDIPLTASESRAYSVTFFGNISEGAVDVAVEAETFQRGTLPGPSCETASIDVDKFVSSDGITWEDADDAPGPQLDQGAQVWFRFDISNVGNVEVSGIGLSDNLYDTSGCTLPDALSVGASTTCTVGPLAVVAGQHTNIATATAIYGSVTISASDRANYYSGDLPQVRIEKFVTKNDSEWRERVRVKPGRPVSFKFVVTNTGNVPLSDLSLTDSVYDTSSCALPESIAPGLSFECVIGPFNASDSDHTNTATISGSFEDQVVTDSDSASYIVIEDDEDDSVIIIIEGPIQNININIITIFDIDIEVDINDPILLNIGIGDTIRVEGDMLNRDGRIVIIAVTIIIIDIDIIVIGPPSGPIFVPIGCKITGIGGSNPRLKCSGRSSRGS